MSIDPSIFESILAMDAYNRGLKAGIRNDGRLGTSAQTALGDAHFVFDDGGQEGEESFYAVAWDVSSQSGFSGKNLVDAVIASTLTGSEMILSTQHELEERITAVRAQVESGQRSQSAELRALTDGEAETQAANLRKLLLDAPIAVKKRYLEAVLDHVCVTKHDIQLAGSGIALAELASGAEPRPRATRVQISVRGWRRGCASNPRPFPVARWGLRGGERLRPKSRPKCGRALRPGIWSSHAEVHCPAFPERAR